jgi:hypothetical protein
MNDIHICSLVASQDMVQEALPSFPKEQGKRETASYPLF